MKPNDWVCPVSRLLKCGLLNDLSSFLVEICVVDSDFIWLANREMHVFLVSGLNAYPPDKPSLGIPNDELKALSQAAVYLSHSGLIEGMAALVGLSGTLMTRG